MGPALDGPSIKQDIKYRLTSTTRFSTKNWTRNRVNEDGVSRDGNKGLTRGYWPDPTLMGQILPGPINSRVESRFLKKTRNGSGLDSSFVKT